MKSLIYSKLILFFSLFLMFNYSVYCQDKVSLVTGWGIPEWLYVGVRFPMNQFQFEVTAGESPIKDDKLFSLTANVYYHFAGKAKLSSRRPWYAKTGIVYLRDDKEYNLDEYIYWNMRTGREFNLSKNLGFSLDAGLIFELNKWTTVKKPEPSDGWNIQLDFPVLPSAGMHLYYRF